MQASDYCWNQCSGYFCGVREEDLWTVTGHTEDIQGGWQSSKRAFPYNNVMSYTFSVWFSVFVLFYNFSKGKNKNNTKALNSFPLKIMDVNTSNVNINWWFLRNYLYYRNISK